MSTVRRPRTLLLTLAATALGLAGGCSVKAPLPTSWTVVPRSGDAAARLVPGGPALGLAHFTAAAEMRTTDLTWRSDEGRLLHQTADRWVDYPDRMFEELLRTTLLQSGRFGAVVPSPPSAGLDAVLHVRLLDFTEWHEGSTVEARVALEWRLLRSGGAVLAQDVIRAAAPMTERSVAGSVKAQQEAALAAARDLAARIAAELDGAKEG